MEQQLANQKQTQQQQFYQQKSQMKQQMQEQFNIYQAQITTPDLSIQHETIELQPKLKLPRSPNKKKISKPANKQPSKVPQLVMPSTKERNEVASSTHSSKIANAAAGSHMSTVQHQEPCQSSVKELIEKASAMQRDCEAHISTPPPLKRKASKNTAMIFGSSIVRHIRGSNIWDSSRVAAKSNCYPGAGIAEIHDHINIKLKYNDLPQTVIVHGEEMT